MPISQGTLETARWVLAPIAGVNDVCIDACIFTTCLPGMAEELPEPYVCISRCLPINTHNKSNDLRFGCLNQSFHETSDLFNSLREIHINFDAG